MLIPAEKMRLLKISKVNEESEFLQVGILIKKKILSSEVTLKIGSVIKDFSLHNFFLRKHLRNCRGINGNL